MSFEGHIRENARHKVRIVGAFGRDDDLNCSDGRSVRAFRLGSRCAAAVAAIGVCAFPALAATDNSAKSLRGPGSLAGYWATTTISTVRPGPQLGGAPTFQTASGQKIPLLPSVAKLVAERRGDLRLSNSDLPCLTEGMPAVAAPPPQYPIEILEKPEQVTVLLEWFRNYRIIRIGAVHPEDPDPAFLGDSVGRWDGGVLVVDTIAINTRTNIMGKIPHSDQLHIVERMRRTGPNTMEDVMMIEDPKTFSKPWTTVIKFKKAAVSNLAGFSCGSSGVIY